MRTRECVPGKAVPDFGASDCDCAAHLLETPGLETLLEAAEGAAGVLETENELG